MLNSEITQKCNEIGTLLFCGPPPRTRGQKRRARTHKLVFRTNNALSGLATTSFDTCCLVPIGSYPAMPTAGYRKPVSQNAIFSINRQFMK